MFGDRNGGGHLWPGINGKSAFPKNWSTDKIMHNVSDVATDPKIPWVQITGKPGSSFTKRGYPVRYEATGMRGEVKFKVIIEPHGDGIITSFPVK